MSRAQSPYESSADFARYAMKLRAQALLKVEPQVFVPTTSRFSTSRYPWKTDIVTTIFWIGEQPTANNPVPNHKSSWDADWARNYGGYDNPGSVAAARLHSDLFCPAAESRSISRCPTTTSPTGNSSPRRRWWCRGFGRHLSSRAIQFATTAGSRFDMAAGFAMRSGRIADRSAPIITNTSSATSGRSRI